MRLLLDTHTFIWYVLEAERLSSVATELINDGNNQVLLSLASVWEIAIKQSIGKMNFSLPIQTFVEQQLHLNDLHLLNIRIEHVATVATLPLHHRDPFDRLLIAQAMVENIPIISADVAFDAYAIQRLW
jgi:PIN domain nuclease of toxin-antitoxin system